MNPRLSIKYWRNVRGMTQEELCNKIGMSKSFLSEIENNKKLPSLFTLYQIAEALEVCPRNLLQCNYIECQNCCYYNCCEGDKK